MFYYLVLNSGQGFIFYADWLRLETSGLFFFKIITQKNPVQNFRLKIKPFKRK